MIPLKYLFIGLAFVGVIATGYFAVQRYNAVIAKNTELEIALKLEKAEKAAIQKTYEGIVGTVNKNDATTSRIVERTTTIEREIAALPVTHDCRNSPAIQRALEALKENNTK